MRSVLSGPALKRFANTGVMKHQGGTGLSTRMAQELAESCSESTRFVPMSAFTIRSRRHRARPASET